MTPFALISPSASFGPSVIGSIPARRSACGPREGLAFVLGPAAADQHFADIGHLGQIALADRADHPHDRVHVGVQQRDEQLDQFAPDAHPGLEHPVDARDHHRPHDIARQRATVGGDLIGDGREREGADLIERDVVARERPEARVEPIHRFAAGEHAVDHIARGANADQRRRIEFDARAGARHREHVVHGQTIAPKCDLLVS